MVALDSPGLVESQTLYRQDELCKRLGWSRKSWDAARKRGLRVLRSGKRAYIRGSDVLTFIEQDAAAQEQRAQLAQA